MNMRKDPVSLAVFMGLIVFSLVVGYGAFYQPSAQEVKYIPYTSSEISEILQSSVSVQSVENTHFKGDKLNINLADEEEITENLDGIGTALAKRIVDYRTENGSFSDISDIMNVKGIGEKTFENIKDKICV
ncbi:MAG: ComEA family DNA-binding protein [Acutalibacteraceae bacterium]